MSHEWDVFTADNDYDRIGDDVVEHVNIESLIGILPRTSVFWLQYPGK